MGGGREVLEGLGSPSTVLDNLVCLISFVLEVDGLSVPFIDLTENSVEGHDSFHEQCVNSNSEETNKYIVVSDAYMDYVTLESQDVTLKQRGEFPVLFGHLMG